MHPRIKADLFNRFESEPAVQCVRWIGLLDVHADTFSTRGRSTLNIRDQASTNAPVAISRQQRNINDANLVGPIDAIQTTGRHHISLDQTEFSTHIRLPVIALLQFELHGKKRLFLGIIPSRNSQFLPSSARIDVEQNRLIGSCNGTKGNVLLHVASLAHRMNFLANSVGDTVRSVQYQSDTEATCATSVAI